MVPPEEVETFFVEEPSKGEQSWSSRFFELILGVVGHIYNQAGISRAKVVESNRSYTRCNVDRIAEHSEPPYVKRAKIVQEEMAELSGLRVQLDQALHEASELQKRMALKDRDILEAARKQKLLEERVQKLTETVCVFCFTFVETP